MVAQSGDPLDSTGDPESHSVGTTANLNIKMSKRISVVKGHFPKLADCAHFHYDNVDLGSIVLQFITDQDHGEALSKDMVFLVQVTCQGKSWMVRRSYEEFCTLDAHLHQCIYDRRYSKLPPLQPLGQMGERIQVLCPMLSDYLSRLSGIIDNKLNCGPVLTWMEIDNRGNRFLLKEEASLNVPAIAAAHVVKRYTAQASDEISIEVGDILSVIDMPPKEETSWWRGKHGFQVGFFPSECVELINEKQTVSTRTDPDPASFKPPSTRSPGPDSPTSVCKKHGKMLGFLRTFIKSRPSKQKLKQRGILRERVFGCDLGEHLLNSGLDVPQVLVSCSEFIEQHGVVDGIYRHSGVSSNIQKLRHEFDSEIVPDLTKEMYMQDIHCVSSLCKLYFRELPNPLLTYQLYEKFADCMGEMSDDERMVKVHDVIQQLPPPHYRTLEYLIGHLSRLATRSEETSMHIKNLSIVWAPNLLRSKEIETAALVGSDPFREVRVQSVVVEFLLSHVGVLFSDSFTSVGKFTQGQQHVSRPKSFVSTRLLSLEEARARTQAPLFHQELYHTVLDAHDNRGKKALKGRKTSGSWRSIFALGRPMRIGSLFQPNMAHFGCRVDSVTLRSAKSEDSLSSQHSGAGSAQLHRLCRPRSSSDGLSLTASNKTESVCQHPPARLPSSRSYDSLLPREQLHGNQGREGEDDEEEEDEEGVYSMPEILGQGRAPCWMAEELHDFSPTFLDDRRASPPGGSPPAYHRVHQAQRPITEDPDSVLNQSEAVARRSLILAATAPPQQVFCQHQPSSSCPVEVSSQSPHDVPQPPERQSFTKKVVNALSPRAPKSPPLDISQPVAISVPVKSGPSLGTTLSWETLPGAITPNNTTPRVTHKSLHPIKVLDMIGGRAGQSQLSTSSPQMISMLLRSCDFQLSDSCQQELYSKLSSAGLGAAQGPAGAPLPPQKPPPPKNPARLMALALTESANRALSQHASPPARPPLPPHPPSHTSVTHKETEPHQQRSLSLDAAEMLNNDIPVLAQQHTVDTEILSSETSVSDPVTSDISGVNSSEDDQSSDPFYCNLNLSSRPSPVRLCRKKPPAYGRQHSAPHLQQSCGTSTTAFTNVGAAPTASVTVSSTQHSDSVPQLQLSFTVSQPTSSQSFQTQLHHSNSESSPLSKLYLPQNSRPKVPPKPADLVAPKRGYPLSQRKHEPPLQVAAGPQQERHPLARSNLRRSLDSGRVHNLIGQPEIQSPLVRAFSERLSGVPDRLARYHAAQTASQLVPACLPPPSLAMAVQQRFTQARMNPEESRDMQNLYHEISGPEMDEPFPYQPPSYSRHSYLKSKLDLEGNFRPVPQPQSQSIPDSYHNAALSSSSQGSQSKPWRFGVTNFPPAYSDSCRSRQKPSSSSVRPTAGSEMHPLPATSFTPLLTQAAASTSNTFSPSLLKGRPVCVSQPPNQHGQHPTPLHPYFENGRVCYRAQQDDAQLSVGVHLSTATANLHKVQRPGPNRQCSQQQDKRTVEPNQPIYVNYPFTLSPSSLTTASSPSLTLPSGQGWATSDLDSPHLTSPGDNQAEGPEHTSTSTSAQAKPDQAYFGGSTDYHCLSSNAGIAPGIQGNEQTPCGTKLEWSEGQEAYGEEELCQDALTGRDIAALLMAKMAEEDGNEMEGKSQFKHQQYHPPNPYIPPQPLSQPPPPPYATALVSRSSFQHPGASRRSSAGGSHYYRQSYDIMPSPDQVLRFQQAPGQQSQMYQHRHSRHNQLYPSHRSSHPRQPPAISSGLHNSESAVYFSTQNHPQPTTGQYLPPKAHDDSAPEASALRGMVSQRGLSGAHWSQTRSYC